MTQKKKAIKFKIYHQKIKDKKVSERMINETISHDILVVRSRALEAQVINHQITQIRQAAS